VTVKANTKPGTKKNSFLFAKLGSPTSRITGIAVVFLAVALVLAARCVYIQGLDLEDNAGKGLTFIIGTGAIPAARGTIYDRNGDVLAQSQPAVNIVTDPTIIATNGLVTDYMGMRDKLKASAGPGIIAGILQANLGGDFDTYYDKLATASTEAGDPIQYALLAQTVLTYVNLKITEEVSSLGYVGLFSKLSPIRTYPNSSLASNVLGFMIRDDELNADNEYLWVGGGGLELALDVNLSGIDGEEVYETSAFGRIPMGSSVLKEPQEGISYTLTIDSGLQYMQDQRLAAAVASARARAGIAITLNIKTGEILAMSIYPTFDSNHPESADDADLQNRAVILMYEPGSVEKVLTMAALVDQGIVTPETRVIVPGAVASGGTFIKDSWYHDTLQLTAAGVIANSSNIGTVLLAREMDKATLVSYLQAFGLGASTRVGLPGEESGDLPDATMSDQTRDQIAFGQGLSVTALQEATAVAAIANGGMYVSPRIISSATASDGHSMDLPEQTVRRVISQDSSTMVLAMMESMANMYPQFTTIEGYRVGAKSGTAEAIDPACGCYRGFVASLVGVAPLEDPQILTYVVLDHPEGDNSGLTVAGPPVTDILSVALARYGIPVSTTVPWNYPLTW
jgi:cell division protein FtsI (penicillin-binding protein 3)